MKSFALYQPDTVSELLKLINCEQDYKILAGGTDLLVRWKRGHFSPQKVINIKYIKELNYINFSNTGLEIGALVKVSELLENSDVQNYYPALAQAALLHSSPQIRHLATVIGNICNASPAADLVPALLVYNAKVKIQRVTGERIVDLKSFFVGPGETILQKGEFVIGVIVPLSDPKLHSIFLKEGKRKAHEIAVVNCAVSFIRENQRIKNLLVAMGAVGPKPIFIEEINWFTEYNQDNLSRLELLIDEVVVPITDQRSTDWYRRDLVKVLVKRAITQSI